MKKNTMLTTCMIALTMCLSLGTLTADDIPVLLNSGSTTTADAAAQAFATTTGSLEQKQAAADKVLQESSKNQPPA